MARRTKKKSLFWTILAIVVAGGVAFFQEWSGSALTPSNLSTKTKITLPSDLEVLSSGRFSPIGAISGKWQEFDNCRLIKGRNNDGDSFHVRYDGKEGEFRLYFVDSPESAYKTYRGGANNGERLDEQGKYFDGLNREQAAAIGKEAKKFALDLLGQKPFTLRTKWENVYGPDRKYCLVVVELEGHEVYLHELLVAKGLARIHTRGADLPGGRPYRSQKDFLRKWESAVKKEGYGAWGW